MTLLFETRCSRIAVAQVNRCRISKISNLFADNGASTLRFGRILTGSNAGDMLLGVTYPSMAEIEASYDAVAASETFMKLASNISINLRNIIRIY